MNISVPTAGSVRVHNDGFHIFLQSHIDKTIEMPWNAALEVAKEMVTQARKIEEKVKANKIIVDQAILIRLGIPLGLSDNPDIKKAAHNEAQYNPDLRRFITEARVIGIPSGEVFGTPGIIQHPSKEGGKDNGEKDI